jgi:hypothetical protein
MRADAVDEAASVGERLDLLERCSSVGGGALGLIEGDEDVGRQAVRRRGGGRTDAPALERESTLVVVAEALLDAALFVSGEVQLGPNGLAAA